MLLCGETRGYSLILGVIWRGGGRLGEQRMCTLFCDSEEFVSWIYKEYDGYEKLLIGLVEIINCFQTTARRMDLEI